MIFEAGTLSLPKLVSEIVGLLPEYLPGVETGPAASTEGRTCWIRTWKGLLTALGRQWGMEVAVEEDAGSALKRQLTLLWTRGDAILMAAYSGWGDRQDLERRFHQLETLKAPHKLLLYSCLKWQEAVLEQIAAALLRYPHHIQGEQYLALNLMGPSQTLGAHLFTVPRSGVLQPDDVSRLPEVPGSPFSWRQKREKRAS